MKISPTSRAAWCIGHDRRLNGDTRGQWNPILFHGRSYAEFVLRFTQGFWRPQPCKKFSTKNPAGPMRPVKRWTPA